MGRYNVFFNTSPVEYASGFFVTREFSEKLDTGTIRLPNAPDMQFTPLVDKIEIEDGAKRYKFLLSAFRKVISSWDPLEFHHELSLVSPTIQLQRIPLPNRTIRHSLIPGSPKPTVWQRLVEYRDVYAPNFTFTQEIEDLTSGVVCPEFTWQRPTLFEVFNDLLSVVNSVVTMPDWDEIGYLDLSERGQEVDVDKINDFVFENSAEEYTGGADVEILNIIEQTSITKSKGFYSVRPSEGEAFLTDTNAVIRTDKPIFKITKFVVHRTINELVETNENPDFYRTISADITHRVLEETQYATLRGSNSVGMVAGNEFRRNAIYYTEGSQEIKGLTYSESTWLGITPKIAIINTAYNVMNDPSHPDYDFRTFINVSNTLFRDLFFFEIEYIAMDGVKVRTVGKYSDLRAGYIIDNQDSTFVDLRAQARKLEDNINRVSAEKGEFRAIYNNASDIPKLSDVVFDDYVVSAATIVFHEDHYDFEAKIRQHFTFQNMFTSIKSRKRYTQLAMPSDALLSHHVVPIRHVVHLGSDPKTPSLMSSYLFSNFNKDNPDKPTVVLFATYGEPNMGSLIKSVLLEVSIHLGHRSIYLTFKTADNFSAGLGISLEDDGHGSYPSQKNAKDVSYVDEEGRFVAYGAWFYSRINNPAILIPHLNEQESAFKLLDALPAVQATVLDELRDSEGDKIGNVPVSTLRPQDVVFTLVSQLRYKDNAEITAETIEVAFREEHGVIIYDLFIELLPLINNDKIGGDLRFYVSTDPEHEYTRKTSSPLSSSIISMDNSSLLLAQGVFKPIINETQWNNQNITAFALTTSDGQLLLATNTGAYGFSIGLDQNE